MADLIVPDIVAPFAYNDHSISFPDSLFGTDMTIPSSQGGTVLNRHVLNGIGFMGTVGLFLDQIGYTYSLPVGKIIGGYHIGAIKRGRGGDGRFREYKYTSGSDTDKEPPFSVEEDPQGTGGNGWSATPSYYPSFSFPVLDLEKASILYSGVKEDDLELSIDVTPANPGAWLYVKRVITGWNELTDEQKTSLGPVVKIESYDYEDYWREKRRIDEDAYADNIPFYEGSISARMFPSSALQHLRISIPERTEGDPSALAQQEKTEDGSEITVPGYGTIELEVRELNLQA